MWRHSGKERGAELEVFGQVKVIIRGYASCEPESGTWTMVSEFNHSCSIWAQECSMHSWARASEAGSWAHRATGPRPRPSFHSIRNGTHWKAGMVCQCRLGLAPTKDRRGKVKVSVSSFPLLFPLTGMGFILYRFKCYIEKKLKWPKCFIEQFITKIKATCTGGGSHSQL